MGLRRAPNHTVIVSQHEAILRTRSLALRLTRLDLRGMEGDQLEKSRCGPFQVSGFVDGDEQFVVRVTMQECLQSLDALGAVEVERGGIGVENPQSALDLVDQPIEGIAILRTQRNDLPAWLLVLARIRKIRSRIRKVRSRIRKVRTRIRKVLARIRKVRSRIRKVRTRTGLICGSVVVAHASTPRWIQPKRYQS